MKLPGDSLDYDVLFRAAKKIKSLPGLVCEIGVRRGGSLKYIIDALKNTNKHIVCIDPYGNIGYNISDFKLQVKLDYTNDMKHESMSNIYSYAYENDVNIIFFNLEDIEFMHRFHDGVPVYDQTKQILNTYSLVFFDGPHDTISIMKEVLFFEERSKPGTIFVFDDITTYNHIEIEKILYMKNFELLEIGKNKRKSSYVKV